MSEIDDELDHAEALMEERSTSAAKDVEFSSYQENAMDRTESMGSEFERAHDGAEQQQTGQEQGQSQDQGQEVRHDPAPNRDGPQPEGPGFDSVRQDAFDQKQADLAEYSRLLDEDPDLETGIDSKEGVELNDGRDDDQSRGR